MKYTLCAGWSICQRVQFPVFSISGRCWLPELPPRPWPIQHLGLTCLSPSILGTTWAASRCSGAWGWGSAAAPPSPLSTVSHCKARGQVTGTWEHPPAPIPPHARMGQGVLSQWGRVRVFQLCALGQGFGVYWDKVRAAALPRCRALRLYQVKTYPLVLISGFALPKC